MWVLLCCRTSQSLWYVGAPRGLSRPGCRGQLFPVHLATVSWRVSLVGSSSEEGVMCREALMGRCLSPRPHLGLLQCQIKQCLLGSSGSVQFLATVILPSTNEAAIGLVWEVCRGLPCPSHLAPGHSDLYHCPGEPKGRPWGGRGWESQSRAGRGCWEDTSRPRAL